MKIITKKYKRILFFFFFIVFVVVAESQTPTPRIKELDEKTSAYSYSGNHDSAQLLVIQYLEQEDLNPLELFYGYFIYGDIIKSAGRPGEALERFNICKQFINLFPDKNLYESLLSGKQAECYFDLQDFDKALIYAKASVKRSPDTSIRVGGHAVNYLIIGHGYFKEKKYDQSLSNYQRSVEQYIRTGNSCELPLCYTKIAKVYNAMGQHALTQKYIDLAVKISDSCNITQYILFSKYAMFEIQRENKNYEKALQQLLEINELVAKTGNENQKFQISELEIKYNTIISEKENQNLKEINAKNEIILEEQNFRFYISITASTGLLFLLIYIIRLSRQRKKANDNLGILNQQLEQKVNERTTHLSDANEKIRTNAELLEHQNTQLTDFCNIVSHNLRSPLVNMSMLVSFIEKSKNGDDKKLLIEKLKPVINNLTETFNELVESLQVRQDKEIKSENVGLTETTKKILEGLEGEIMKSQAEIETDFSEAPVIRYPPQYLTSILHNLVSNAIKYRSPDRKAVIKIKSGWSAGNILLTVADNGLGIDLVKHRDKIFKIRKIFHEHPDAKGFGLYITKTQVETMGDKIWLESQPDKGSTFFVEFKKQSA